jgi:hypothetical protein
MHRSLSALVALVLVVGIAGAAHGKGAMPQSANMSGPGIDGTITFGDPGAPGGTSADGNLNLLATETKLFNTLFGDGLIARPTGPLGPRYVISWTMVRELGSHRTFEVRSDFYPYAKGGPVMFTHGGQKVRDEAGTRVLHSGWIKSNSVLTANLQAWGLPRQHVLPGTEASSSAPIALWLIPIAALGLIAAAAMTVVRRKIMTVARS